MKKSLVVISLFASLMCNSVFAGPFDNQQYGVQIDKPSTSSIQDFKVTGDNFNAGSVIKFVVDGESDGQVSIKFISSGKFSRTVNLKETEPGLYTGQYLIRSVDQLEGKTFTATFTEGKSKYTALYSPVSIYTKNVNINSNSKQAYKNPDFGAVSMVEVKEVAPSEVNYGGTAIGAVVGGVLGNQVGGGNGKKAATVLGAIAGGVAGNQIGKNMTKQSIWYVHVNFEDGQKNIYQFSQDPQIANGTLVKKDGQTIVRR